MFVTVSKRIVRGVERWCVDSGLPGQKRTRKLFTSQRAALASAARKQEELDLAGSAWASIPEPERLEIIAVVREMREAGVSIKRLWDQHRATPTIAAARGLSDVVRELIHIKRESGRRRAYVDTLESALLAFSSGREQSPISAITTHDIEEWARAKYSNSWSRKTAHQQLSTLFAFAKRRGYVLSSPTDSLERIQIDWKAPEVLTPDQAKSVMEWCVNSRPHFLPWLTLCLFSGLRPSEADRMTWESVSLEQGTVTIDAAASKVRRRRIVRMEAPALSYMRLAQRQGSEMPIAHTTRRRCLRALRDHLGMERWTPDLLRHTAASYLLALHRDAQRVALELGNSPEILFRHYRELVTQEATTAFWSIMPRQ